MSGRVAAPVLGPERHETTQAWWMPYALQWAGGVLTLPIGALAHTMWGDNLTTLPWVTIAMTLAGAALATATFKITSTKKFLQVHATLSVALGMLWLTAATVTGPFEHPLIDVWLLGMPAVTGSWSIRRLIGRGQKTGDGENGDSKLLTSVKLAKTKIVGEIEVGPNRATANLQLPPGQLTADDVTQAKSRLASALSVSPTSVRVAPDPDRHDRATLVVVPQDMLKTSMPWPGPSSPGGSIADPLNVGLYGDGVHADFWLPGDVSAVRNATHMLVMGMNGSGKSYGAKELWTEILTRRDVKLWIADGAKGLQTVGRFAPYADWVEPSAGGAQNMLAVLPAVIEKRASALAEEGLEQWVPGCSLKYLVVWIEEASKVIREADDIADIVQTARSAGVSIVLSLQRPSYTQIPVDVRNQLGCVWCFGVKDNDDAAFALDDALIERGANPAAWKNRKPGYSYLEAPGLDEDRMVEPLRTWKTDGDDALIDAIAEIDPHQYEMDAVTAAAAGRAYANRTRYTVDQHGKPVPLPAGTPGTRTANSANPAPTGDTAPHSTDRKDAIDRLVQAAELVITAQFGSTSMLQRKLRANHAEATTLMRRLEDHGVVGPQPEDLDQDRPVLVAVENLEDALQEIREDEENRDSEPPKPAPAGIHGHLKAADETEEAMALPTNPDPELGDIDIDTELPTVEPEEDFTLPTSKPTPAEADAALMARLDEIRATGTTSVRPKDIGKKFFDDVRSRPWVSARLKALAMTGALIETDQEGVYLFPDADAA